MLRYLPIFIFASMLGLLFMILLDHHGDDSPMIGAALPPLALHNLNSEPVTPDFSGKPYIISFYASWCVPCLAEHPLLLELKQSGITILGIGWRDEPENLSRWLSAHGNPYSMSTLDPKSEAAISMGITGVPESFLVGGDGIIKKHWRGPLTEDDVDYIKRAAR